MTICLLGKNLTNLILAQELSNKSLNVHILYDRENKKQQTDRTIGISKNNFYYLKSITPKMNIHSWPIKKIEIYQDKITQRKLIDFKIKNEVNFFLVKYIDLFNYFKKVTNKNKYIKFKKISSYEELIKKKDYKILVNSNTKNYISKKYFSKKIEKDYNSRAYTTILSHSNIENNTAVQIFTMYGPIAYLPLSKNKTSVVLSIRDKYKFNINKINNLIIKFNPIYKKLKINKLEKSKLIFSISRKYSYKNILSFGDALHKIHPLAGQGFNMTLRDIKVLSKIIDEKLSLGLDIDINTLDEFEEKTKHSNYFYSSSIDFIYNFFIFDNELNNMFSKPIFKFLKGSKNFNKYMNRLADLGFHSY